MKLLALPWLNSGPVLPLPETALGSKNGAIIDSSESMFKHP